MGLLRSVQLRAGTGISILYNPGRPETRVRIWQRPYPLALPIPPDLPTIPPFPIQKPDHPTSMPLSIFLTTAIVVDAALVGQHRNAIHTACSLFTASSQYHRLAVWWLCCWNCKFGLHFELDATSVVFGCIRLLFCVLLQV